jgi:WD40 repeat protein
MSDDNATQPQVTPPDFDKLDATRAQSSDAPVAGLPDIPGYDLLPEIARGGMGVVYRAYDHAFGREVAVKVMLPGMNAAEFVREARITGRLPHPGIPPVYALGTLPDGRPFLAMKLIRGDTLDKVLKARTDLTADRGKLLAAFEQICQAVGYAHAQEIIHRDLKPSNVMVGAFGEVQVMDWGLAKELRSAEPEPAAALAPMAALEDVPATVAGTIKGTPAYMAPEQARGEPVGPRADVFALGGILAVILTGKPPFAGGTVAEIVGRAARADINDCFAQLDISRVEDLLSGIAKKCLAPLADDRYADATELAQAIAAYRSEVEGRLLRQIEHERDKLAVLEYGRTMQIAHQEWRDGNIVAMRTLLDGTDLKLRNWEWRYLNRLYDPSILKLRGTTASFSPDGMCIVTAHHAAVGVRVWNALTGAMVLELDEIRPRKPVLSASFSADGTRIVAAHNVFNAFTAGTASVWDATTGAVVCTLKGHTKQVYAASFSPDGTHVVTASRDRTARVWDARTGAEVLMFKGHTKEVYAASFSPDGAWVVTAGEDRTARVWDARTGAEVLVLKGHTGVVRAAAYSPDGTRIVTAGGNDVTARVWDARTGAELLALKGHTVSVNAASFSPEGTRVVTASSDRTARVWDARTGAEVLMFKGHTAAVTTASFSPDGTHVVTASTDGTARVWKGSTSAEAFTLIGLHTGIVNTVAFSPDDTRIATGSNDLCVWVWNVKSHSGIFALKGHSGRVNATAFSADGSRILTGSADKTSKIWDANTGEDLLTLVGHTKCVNAAAFSPDGRYVVTGSDDQTARLWDVQSGCPVRILSKSERWGSVIDQEYGYSYEANITSGHTDAVLAVAFSPDGQQIATGSEKTVFIWGTDTGELLFARSNHESSVRAVSYSPDGTRILTTSDDGTANVCDAKTRTKLFSLKGHIGGVRSAMYSPDGTRIVTAGEDKTSRVWDAQTGAEVLTLKGHTEYVTTVAFSRDGTRIVTGSCDQTVKVWDAPHSPTLTPPAK